MQEEPISNSEVERIEASITKLEQKYEERGFHKKTCFQLLELYSKVSSFQKANELRVKMHKLITFTEDQWINWLTEELTEANDNSAKKKDVLKVFHLAFDDGYFPQICEMYLQFVGELLEENILKKQATKIMSEKAIGMFCQDFTVGSAIFKRCRTIELSFQKKLKATDKQYLESQNYLRQLFQREFKLGLSGIQKSYLEYQSWETDADQKKKTDEIYNKALNETFPIFKQFNDQLDASDNQPLFLQQIITQQNQALQEEDKENNAQATSIDTPKIIAGFEKVLSNLKMSKQDNVWKEYIQYLREKKVPAQQMSKSLRRATKICVAEVDLQAEYLRVLEKQGAEFSFVQEEAERLFSLHDSQLDNQYILYSGYLGYCTRYLRFVENPYETENQFDETVINPKNVLLLRKAYEKAIEFYRITKKNNQAKEQQEAADQCGAYIDDLTIKYAEMESYILKDHDQMTSIMEKFMKSNGETLSCWKKYFELERHFGKIQNMRGLIKRACEYVKDDIFGALQLLVDFESDYGTIDQVEEAIDRQLTKALEINQQNQEEQNQAEGEAQLETGDQEAENKQTEIEEEVEDEDDEDTQQVELVEEEAEEEGEGEVQEQEQEEEEIKELNGKRKNEKTAKEQSGSKKFKPSQETKPISSGEEKQKSTIFIKNLPHEYIEQDIIQLFTNKDNLRAIRLVKGKFGRTKGFAYVDFDSDEEAKNACLMLNQAIVEGQKLYVALSAPPKKQTHGENCTAFLNNLPFKIQDEEIKQAFEGAEINQIRIIRNENGLCKGFCYVEFTSEDEFNKAHEIWSKNPLIGKRKIIWDKADGNKPSSSHHKDKGDMEIEENEGQNKNDNKRNTRSFVAFLKNVGYKTRESDLQNFFSELNIDSITIAKDERGQPKGFGFVSFNDQSSLTKALAIGKGTIRGKEFEIVKYDKPAPKKDEEKKQIEAKENKSNEDFRKLFF